MGDTLVTEPTEARSVDGAQQPRLTAQTIACGDWQLAFSLAWTTLVVEQFALSNIPRAPYWLSGCANIEGAVVPVINLQSYFDANGLNATNSSAPPRHQRLLVGATSRQAADDTLAIGFSGLPAQIQYFRAPIDNAVNLPPRLAEICSGLACCEDGRRFIEIDTSRLCDVLAHHALQD